MGGGGVAPSHELQSNHLGRAPLIRPDHTYLTFIACCDRLVTLAALHLDQVVQLDDIGSVHLTISIAPNPIAQCSESHSSGQASSRGCS